MLPSRRLLSAALFTRRRLAILPQTSLLRLSSTTTGPPPPLHPPPPPIPAEHQPTQHSEIPGASSSTWNTSAENSQHRRSSRGGEAKYEEEQIRVLRAALPHVVKFGWSETAILGGARDVGVSPSIVGSFPRKDAALVEFFMDDCLQKLIDIIDSENELNDLILSDRIAKLIRIRLEMQAPYISKWPQALSIQAQPPNLPTSFKQRTELIDEIWHGAGDTGSEFDWYVKRTVLGGIYSTTEVYMVTDHSPDFRDAWTFLENRIKDAFDLQKTVQEAAYLAEAVGAGMGNTMQGVMRKLFQG